MSDSKTITAEYLDVQRECEEEGFHLLPEVILSPVRTTTMSPVKYNFLLVKPKAKEYLFYRNLVERIEDKRKHSM